MLVPHITLKDIVNDPDKFIKPYHSDYLAMYSTFLKGIVRDPVLMTVPIDDHMVHRGDGVFEVFKCINGNIYQLEAHLKRLENSRVLAFIREPDEYPDIRGFIIETIKAGGSPTCMIRLFIGRGPGSMTANPYDCKKSYLYIFISMFHPCPEEMYEKGVSVITSKIPLKPGVFANIKSLNYLPNVMMAREAQDAGVKFVLSLDEDGYVAEGSTENIGIVDRDDGLIFPGLDRILEGTTLARAVWLAKKLVSEGLLTDIRFEPFKPDAVYKAKEMIFFGTTLDALPGVLYNGHEIGGKKIGPVAKRLLSLIREDIKHGDADILTRVDF